MRQISPHPQPLSEFREGFPDDSCPCRSAVYTLAILGNPALKHRPERYSSFTNIVQPGHLWPSDGSYLFGSTRRRFCGCLFILALLLSACDTTPPPIPTVSSIEMAGTSVSLTQNAPPAGFEKSVAFPVLDAHLTDLPGWYASIDLSFDGIFAGSKQKTVGKLNAQIYSSELTSARRVLFTASGAAFGVTDARAVEAVRLGNDYFLVVQATKVCGKVTDAPSRRIADLTAGTLLGGIKSATPTGQRDTINKLAAWEYAFLPDDVTLPILNADSGGNYTVAAGDLWVAPAVRAVVRYTLTINVENVTLLQSDQPVTGQLRIIYELHEVGTQYNITVPFGC